VAFTPRTEAEILRSLVARALAYTQLTDTHEGGVALGLLGAAAKELARAEQQGQTIANLGDLELCVGADLDARAAEVLPAGEVRTTSQFATSTVVFSRAAGDTVGVTAIPVGQVVARGSDGELYATTAAGSVLNGALSSAPVPVQASKAGISGNCGIGAISVLRSPPARIVAVANVTAGAGGVDEETDTSLRNRIRNHCRGLSRCIPSAVETAVRAFVSPTGGQVRYLKRVEIPPRASLYVDDGTGALDVSDVVAAGEVLLAAAVGGETVLFLQRQALKAAPATIDLYRPAGVWFAELKNGIHYSVELPWGQVSLGVTLVAGDALIVTGAYSAYTGLVADVQKLVDGDPYDLDTTPGLRALGTATRVIPAGLVPVTMSLDVTWVSGLGATALAAAQLAVVNAVVGLVNSLEVGAPLYLAAIVDVVMETADVLNVRVVTLAGTTPAADKYPGASQVLRTTSAGVTLT